jgi:hypothetical protein
MTRKSKIILSSVLVVVCGMIIGVGIYRAVFATATNQAGVGYGAIGMDAYSNVSVGSSSPAGIARFVVNASSGASTYTLKALSSTGASLFSVDNSGNVVTAGSLTAGSFVGNISGTVTANNVSSGAFGANTGGGNYVFPAALTMNGYNQGQIDFNSAGSNWGNISSPSANTWALGYGTGGGATLGTQVLSWNSSGNVGIGTTAPNGKFDVYADNIMSATAGDITLEHPTSGGASSIIFPSRSNYGSDYGFITYYDEDTTYAYWGTTTENSALVLGAQNDPMDANSDVVALNGAAADVIGTIDYPSTMVVNDAGNVGIGNTGPSYKLDVAGQIRSSSGGYVFPDGSVQTTAYSNGGGNKNWYWSGQSGQPPWVWGGSDGTNMYVYNPSNFSVNYANSAGSLSNNNISQFNNNSGYITAASLSFRNMVAYSTAGTYTWTAPAGVTEVYVEVAGGGGGGSGGVSGSSASGGGGGGAGGVAEGFVAVTPGSQYTVTVGAAGAAGSVGGGQGGVGGASSFNGLTGNGGSGAQTHVNMLGGPQGAGGTASGGTVNLTGNAGVWGMSYFSGWPLGGMGGNGGGNALGGGGSGGTWANTNGYPGTAGSAFGGGGGGGSGSSSSGTGGVGSAGGAGGVILEW